MCGCVILYISVHRICISYLFAIVIVHCIIAVSLRTFCTARPNASVRRALATAARA